MPVNIAQLHRVVFRTWDASANDGKGDWETFTIEADNLGQDSIAEIEFAPRMMSRASSVGTSETPIPGTFDTLSATLTFLADNWELLGKALRNWKPATYAGATNGNGQILIGGNADYCGANNYLDVIIQGICDDGSSADVEITRCMPALDGSIAIGGSDAMEVTLALHPIIYNLATHANDGYPAYTMRFGDESLEEKMRLNATTGVYQPAGAETTTPEVENA